MAAIELRGVAKHFSGKGGRTQVLEDIDITVGDGELCVFVGPSGCGKSTLLRIIAGLETVSAGDVIMNGERVNHRTPPERGIAMVFQSYALYPHMTVYRNMAFGLKMGRAGKAKADAAVREAARALQLEDLLDRRPAELSGGQRQRVAIGRAIVREPRVFLFDEPLSNLDAALRSQTRLELARLHKRLGTTMVYVTHDQVEAMTLADRIVVLDHGHVAQAGTPLELYHHPRNRFVASFIGSPTMNFIDASVGEVSAVGVTVATTSAASLALPFAPGDAARGDTVTLGVRPEHLTPCNAGEGWLQATVEVVERLGDVSYVYSCLASGQTLVSAVNGNSPASAGDAIGLQVTPSAAHLFQPDGVAFAPRANVVPG